MRQPIQIIKVIGLLLLLLLFLMSVTMTVQGAEPITLLDMQKQENPDSTRMTFHFSSLPKFTTEHSGQRVDLLLSQVQLSSGLRSLPEDERIVKILLAEKKQELLVSILLRRHPGQVITKSEQTPARIIMDFYWGSSDTIRPAIAFKIANMPPRKAGRRANRLQQESHWEDRWDEFFRDYRTYWELKLPVSFTLPQLPALMTDVESPLWPLQQHADNNMFLSLIQTAVSLSGLDQQQRYLRDLLLTEAQLRTGATESAIARLDSLRRNEGTNQVRVEYLTAYGQALEGQPMIAQLTLQALLPDLAGNHPLEPFIQFLCAETALDSGLDSVALEHLLTANLNWPDSLLVPLKMRLADAYAGVGRLDEAVAAYRNLAEEPGLFDYYRSSCNRAAFSAFKNQNYLFSSRLYRKLMDSLQDQPGDDLLLFGAGTASYEAGYPGWGMIGLQRATLDFPESEGGDRGVLRLIDLKVINGGEPELAQVLSEYAQLGQQSQFRPIREESQFKHALALYLLGQHRDSINDLIRFRREFRTSELIKEADALILQLLPIVVHQLIGEKNYLRAVVLAEKNRKLLLRSGFDKNFLSDLATAFDQLGLYERESRVLLYLFDRATGKPGQQLIYLPLAQSYLKRGEYQQATKYASRYIDEFPDGEDADALFGILLDTFEREDRQDELLAWLDRKNRPSSPELEIRAAHTYWREGRLKSVIQSLERAQKIGTPLEVKEMALLGEAYYQSEKNRAAEKIYLQLHEDPDLGVQARYRTAQIL
ncbi:MAG: tetratricopeptide repeat protein, partial [Thermodesulfobacteriota bacterium]|nr:tetratricopeptide repeat protein [Thermodesulfobacteriota bacterium]